MVGRLKEILAAHPGTTEVHLQLAGKHEHVLRLDRRRSACAVTPR